MACPEAEIESGRQIIFNQYVKVSVLIPVYNNVKYLGECLDSVLAQDFTDMEILIADDGSTDGTLQIIMEYATRDARIRWWQNPKNLGFVGNHNYCLQQARGEYVKFVHADDKFLSPSAIRKLAVSLDENPSALLAGSQQHVTGGKSKPMIFSKISGLYKGRQMIIACLEQNGNLIGQPILTLFRRAAAQRGFDDRFVGHLDIDMWFHLLEQGDFFFLAETLATWRVHETQQTARHEKSGASHHEQLLLLTTYYEKPWLKMAATNRMLFAQIHYLKKHYGRQAEPLTSAMMSQLKPHHFVWQWLKHNSLRPLQKLGRKAGWTSQLLSPCTAFTPSEAADGTAVGNALAKKEEDIIKR
jgi:glycosyltransferase involved in cell wall biosynthesis